MQKKIFIAFFSLILFSSCSLFGKNTLEEQYHSQLVGETLLPQDILGMVKFSTSDATENTNFQKITKLFSPEEETNTIETLIQNELKNYQIDYQTEIIPLIGTGSETIFAIRGELTEETPELYLIQKIKDQTTYTNLIDKLLAQKQITAIPEGYSVRFNPAISEKEETQIYFNLKDNFIILTNQLDNLKNSLQLETANSLVYAKNYAQIRENLQSNPLCFFYLNTLLLNQGIKNEIPQSQTGTNTTSLNSPWLKLITGLGGSLSAQTDGFKITGYAPLDTKIAQELDVQVDNFPNQATYLDKKIPGNKTFFYNESFNLKAGYEKFEKSLETSSPGENNQILAQIKTLETMTGFKIKEDLMTWLDKGLAFSVQDSGYALPAITLLIDANSNPTGAKKLITTLDSFLTIAVLGLKDYSQALEKTDLQVGQSTFKRYQIIPTNLPVEIKEKGGIILDLLNGLELSYGITEDNYFILSSYPALSDEYKQKTLADAPNYQTLKSTIQAKSQGIAYLAPFNLVENIERLEIIIPFNNSDQTNLIEIKRTLNLIQGSILSRKMTDSAYEYQGYIKIQE